MQHSATFFGRRHCGSRHCCECQENTAMDGAFVFVLEKNQFFETEKQAKTVKPVFLGVLRLSVKLTEETRCYTSFGHLFRVTHILFSRC